MITVHQRYRQMDGQTTYHGNTALRYASRGKKIKKNSWEWAHRPSGEVSPNILLPWVPSASILDLWRSTCAPIEILATPLVPAHSGVWAAAGGRLSI